MGIEKFSQFFKTQVIREVIDSPEIWLIDANFFWEKLNNYHAIEPDALGFSQNFFSFCFNNLLRPSLARQAQGLSAGVSSRTKRIEFVFDNATNRNFLKQARCVQRMRANAQKYVNIKKNVFCTTLVLR